MDRKLGVGIGGILKERRKQLNLTLPELGMRAGIQFSCISRIERGKRRATADTLVKLAKPLGYSKLEILTMAGYLNGKESKT